MSSSSASGRPAFRSEVPATTVKRDRYRGDVRSSDTEEAIQAVVRLINEYERRRHGGYFAETREARAYKQDEKPFRDGKKRRVFFVPTLPELKITRYSTFKELLVDLMASVAFYYGAKRADEQREILAGMVTAIRQYDAPLGYYAFEQRKRLEPWAWNLLKEQASGDDSLAGHVRRTELCDAQMEEVRNIAKQAGYPNMYVSTETYRPRGLLLTAVTESRQSQLLHGPDRPSCCHRLSEDDREMEAEEIPDADLVPGIPFRNPSPPKLGPAEKFGDSHFADVSDKRFPNRPAPQLVENPAEVNTEGGLMASQPNVQVHDQKHLLKPVVRAPNAPATSATWDAWPPSFVDEIAGTPPPMAVLPPSLMDVIARTPPPPMFRSSPAERLASLKSPSRLVPPRPVILSVPEGGTVRPPLVSSKPLSPPPPLAFAAHRQTHRPGSSQDMKTSTSPIDSRSLCRTTAHQHERDTMSPDDTISSSTPDVNVIATAVPGCERGTNFACRRPLEKLPSSSTCLSTEFDFEKWFQIERISSKSDADAITMIFNKFRSLRRKGMWKDEGMALHPGTVYVRMEDGGVENVLFLRGERKMELTHYGALDVFFADVMGEVIATSAAKNKLTKQWHIAVILDGISRQESHNPELEEVWIDMDVWVWKFAGTETLNLNEPDDFTKHLRRCDAYMNAVHQFAERASVSVSAEVCTETYFPPGTAWRNVMSRALLGMANAVEVVKILKARQNLFVSPVPTAWRSRERGEIGFCEELANVILGASNDDENTMAGDTTSKDALVTSRTAGLQTSLSATERNLVEESSARLRNSRNCTATEEKSLQEATDDVDFDIIDLASPEPPAKCEWFDPVIEETSSGCRGAGTASGRSILVALMGSPEGINRSPGDLLVDSKVDSVRAEELLKRSSKEEVFRVRAEELLKRSSKEEVFQADDMDLPEPFEDSDEEPPVKRGRVSCDSASVVKSQLTTRSSGSSGDSENCGSGAEEEGIQLMAVPPPPSLRSVMVGVGAGASSSDRRPAWEESKPVRVATPALEPPTVPSPPSLRALLVEEVVLMNKSTAKAVFLNEVVDIAGPSSLCVDESVVTSSQSDSVQVNGFPTGTAPSAIEDVGVQSSTEDSVRVNDTGAVCSEVVGEPTFEGNRSAAESKGDDRSGKDFTSGDAADVMAVDDFRSSDLDSVQAAVELPPKKTYIDGECLHYREKLAHGLKLAKKHRKRFPHHVSLMDRCEVQVEKVIASQDPGELKEAVGILLRNKCLEGVIKLLRLFLERFTQKMRSDLKKEMESCVAELYLVLNESKKLYNGISP